MITNLTTSSQPYLYANNSNLFMLYCYAESPTTRTFGTNSYQIRPWKIKLANLNTEVTTSLNTISALQDYGQVVIECNPHIFIYENQIQLCYTAGFAKTTTAPIRYYFCSMKSDDLNFNNLYDFQILASTFNGTYLDHNNYLLIDKKSSDVDTIVQKSKLNNSIVNTYSNFNLEEILRIVNVFNSNKFLITGRQGENYISYLLDNSLSIEQTIKNNNQQDLYKCSIYPKVLAYTNIVSSQGIEERSIVIEYSL